MWRARRTSSSRSGGSRSVRRPYQSAVSWRNWNRSAGSQAASSAAPETQPEAQEQPQAGGGLSVAAIVLLCVLGAAGLGLLYFLFRPAHKKRAHEEEAEEFYG